MPSLKTNYIIIANTILIYQGSCIYSSRNWYLEIINISSLEEQMDQLEASKLQDSGEENATEKPWDTIKRRRQKRNTANLWSTNKNEVMRTFKNAWLLKHCR